MTPQTLRVGRGYSASFVVTLRDEYGLAVEDFFDGTEELSLVIADDDDTPLSLIGSSVEWRDASLGTVTLHIDDSDTASLSPKPRTLSIGVVYEGEAIEGYVATLRVGPRARAAEV